MPRPEIRELPLSGGIDDALVGHQDTDFDGEVRRTPIYDRAKLGAGAKLRGPAIVSQLDATTLLFPGQVAEVARFGSLVIQEG